MRDKNSPGKVWNWTHMRRIAVQTLRESTTDRVSLAAAGCAFYATLALFPAMSMLISVYGLMFDPVSVEPQLQTLADVLPPPAFALIEARIHELIYQPKSNLSLGLLIGFVLTFWSSASGAKAVVSAVNVAYDVTDQRSFLRFEALGLTMTMTAVLCAVLAIAVLVALPVAIGFLGLSGQGGALIQRLGLLMLIGFFAVSIALLYRFGPCRRPPPNQRVAPGVILATLLWLVASEILSWYVSSMANYGATYGSIGAVVGVMLWFYVSAYAVLLGAELNARLEKQAPIEEVPNRPRTL